MPQLFLVPQPVEFGSVAHIAPIVLGAVFAISIISYAKHKLNLKSRRLLFNALGFFVSFMIVANQIHLVFQDNYDYKENLPLWLCSLMGLLIPVFTLTRKFWMFEIILFWILGGSTQGVIVPNINGGFLSLDYFRFWTTHIGLFTIIFYAIIIFKMWPNFKSPIKSILALQLYVFLIFILNLVLDTNFFFLNDNPDISSHLDFFGKWPYYIFNVQLILIPFFLLLYLPFYLIKHKKKSTSQITDSYP